MSPVPSPRSSRRPSGWSLAALGVALTPARALTSYLRRHYFRHYEGRIPNAPFVFGLDLCLATLAFTLALANIILFLSPSPKAPGIGLTFLAPPIVSGAPVALEARLTSQDEKTHEGVRLTWDLPEGAEVLFADPPLTTNHEAFLGRVAPHEPKVARLALRVFAPLGTTTFGFRVDSGFKHFEGKEMRSITKSALVFKPMIETESVPTDVDVPFLLKNTSDQVLDTVEIVVLSGGVVEGRDRLLIGDLAPGASRAILIHTANENGPLAITASSRGVPLVSLSSAVEKRSNPSTIQNVSIRSNPREKQITIEAEAGGPGFLLAYHPALVDAEDGFKIISIKPKQGIQRFTLALHEGRVSVDRWFVLPFEESLSRVPGPVLFGRIVQERIAQELVATIQGRYYAVNGDQLGIGPLPPRVGETTKYWIFWQVPPRAADYRDVRLEARLAPGTHLTGREALPQGGALSQTADGVVWSTPFLSTDIGPVTVGFEISFTPTESMRGQTPLLIKDTVSYGVDVRTGTATETHDGTVDTTLSEDMKAFGKGTVE